MIWMRRSSERRCRPVLDWSLAESHVNSAASPNSWQRPSRPRYSLAVLKRRCCHSRTMEPDSNPYASPNQTAVNDPVPRQGSILAFVRKVLLTCVWTLLFFFGSAVFLGFAAGLYFTSTSSASNGPTQQELELAVLGGTVIPLVLGAVGILLGILGYLPGTRWKPNAEFSKS